MKRGLSLLKNTEIFNEVDLEKNKDIDFNKLSYRSGKKIWWTCKKNGHSFKSTPHHRSRGSGCPGKGCRNNTKKVIYLRSIAYLYPELAKLWHPTKNKDLKPESANGNKKHWYICKKKHEFFVKGISKKNLKTTEMCSRCGGRIPSVEKNFEIQHPEIAKEWDYKKNKTQPNEYTRASKHKAWWICKKSHSYKMPISSRTSQFQSCSKCRPNISRAQIRIYAELKSIFPKTKLKKIINKIEIDVFLPEVNIGIEYDGARYHKLQFVRERDIKKNQRLNKLGIHLIRVRDRGLDKLFENDILQVKSLIQKKEIDEILIRIKKIISDPKYIIKIDDYLSKKIFININLYNKEYLNFPFPIFENSLANTHENLLKEWDYKKNKKIRPEHFNASNPQKVWWICEKEGHSWYASISDRTYKKAKCRICNEVIRNKRLSDISKNRKGIKKEFWPDRNNSSNKL
jgi:hypothetical protein